MLISWYGVPLCLYDFIIPMETCTYLDQVDKVTGQSEGDILVFLTGREEIESVQDTLLRCSELFPSDWLDMCVCPLFAALPSSLQHRVFQPGPQGSRKVILSTNIAETSITIPGVRYVVDTGVVKARGYNPHVGLDLLTVQPISKAQVRCMGSSNCQNLSFTKIEYIQTDPFQFFLFFLQFS